MRCELPEFARCCFCFPLRIGLLAWAYIKLVFSLLFLVNTLGYIVAEYRRGIYFREFPFICAHIFTVATIADVAFLIVFIVSAHTKNINKMKIFYVESICALAFYVLCVLTLFILSFTRYVFYAFIMLMVLWTFAFWTIIMQAYIVFLVKSEILKLERSTNYQFVNHTTDDETSAETVKVVSNNDYA